MTLNQIRSKIYLLTSTSGPDDFPDDQLVGEVNNSLDRLVSLIFQASGRWQWDDSNRFEYDGTTERGLPIATTDLNANQQDYLLDVTHLEIDRVEVQDTTGAWHKLIPIDQKDVTPNALTDYLKDAGLPTYYDKRGDSLFLYPRPNYDLEEGLEVYFQRGGSYFTTNDTTKQAGINTLYHDLLALWPAYNFAIANGKSNANTLMTEIQMREESLASDYALRDRDDHIRMKSSLNRWN